MIRLLRRWFGWDAEDPSYRELQESARQMDQQREYVTRVIRTAPEAEKRIRMLWERERCRQRWLACRRDHCMARWREVKAQPRAVPIPLRREAAGGGR